jgi:hypothetical protein
VETVRYIQWKGCIEGVFFLLSPFFLSALLEDFVGVLYPSQSPSLQLWPRKTRIYGGLEHTGFA